jgi:hypothetical protein
MDGLGKRSPIDYRSIVVVVQYFLVYWSSRKILPTLPVPDGVRMRT